MNKDAGNEFQNTHQMVQYTHETAEMLPVLPWVMLEMSGRSGDDFTHLLELSFIRQILEEYTTDDTNFHRAPHPLGVGLLPITCDRYDKQKIQKIPAQTFIGCSKIMYSITMEVHKTPNHRHVGQES